MTDADRSDIIALAAQAKKRGIDDPAKVVIALEAIIERNKNYQAYRRSRGRATAYDSQVAQDNEALAMAIVLLESFQ